MTISLASVLGWKAKCWARFEGHSRKYGSKMQPMKVPSYSLGSGRPDTTDQAIGADIDPELECQLAQASGDQAVEAVFFLRQDGRGARRQDRLSALLKLAGERQP